jgi:predicted nucleic acid-binding Zn finger protein
MSTKQAILCALARYGGLTCMQLLLAFFPHLTRKAIEKALRELIRDGLVTGSTFRGNEFIYRLTPTGARLMGLDEKRYRRPPRPATVIEQQVMFTFCRCRDVVQDRMTRGEFCDRFSGLAVERTSFTRYYIDVTAPEKPRLGLLVPDYGAGLSNLVRKCRRQIGVRWGEKDDPTRVEWRRWIAADNFQATVITSTESMGRRLRESLRNSQARVVVVVIPELADMIIRRET